jgi:hypothetical protein
LPNPTRAQSRALSALQDALNEELGDRLYVVLGRYDNQKEALEAVCGNASLPKEIVYGSEIRNPDETAPVVLAWLNPFTYFAATQRGCAVEPVWGIKTSDGITDGKSFEFIYKARQSNSLRPTAIFGGIVENPDQYRVCRVMDDEDSELAWIYLNLTFHGFALNPTGVAPNIALDRNPLKSWEIVEVATYKEMVRALHFNNPLNPRERNYEGVTCDFGIIPTGKAPEIIDEAQTDLREELANDTFTIDFDPTGELLDARYIRPILPPEDRPWVTIPFDLFVTVSENVLPAEIQQLLLRALQTVIESDDGEENLQRLLEYDELQQFLTYEADETRTGAYNRVQLISDYYANFLQWLQNAEWGMAN